MDNSTKPLREFQAYSSEVLHADHLPPWSHKARVGAAEQALEQYDNVAFPPGFVQAFPQQHAAMLADAEALRALVAGPAGGPAADSSAAAAAAMGPGPASAAAGNSSSAGSVSSPASISPSGPAHGPAGPAKGSVAATAAATGPGPGSAAAGCSANSGSASSGSIISPASNPAAGQPADKDRENTHG